MTNPSTETVLEDAEITACYFRALLDKSVPVQAAINLTSSYVSAFAFARRLDTTPKPPWEQD